MVLGATPDGQRTPRGERPKLRSKLNIGRMAGMLLLSSFNTVR